MISRPRQGADRNGDNWDSPQILERFFNKIPVKTNPFGITLM